MGEFLQKRRRDEFVSGILRTVANTFASRLCAKRGARTESSASRMKDAALAAIEVWEHRGERTDHDQYHADNDEYDE